MLCAAVGLLNFGLESNLLVSKLPSPESTEGLTSVHAETPAVSQIEGSAVHCNLLLLLPAHRIYGLPRALLQHRRCPHHLQMGCGAEILHPNHHPGWIVATAGKLGSDDWLS